VTARNQTCTPSRLQHISLDIIGIKLEPIVNLASLHPVGAEVLSVLHPNLQNERFFHRQPAAEALTLLEAQLAALKNSAEAKNLFINLPITVFTEHETFQRILQLSTPPLNIEIVEPAAFFSLAGRLRARVIQRLQQLARLGHRIWLDDIDEVLVQPFLSCQLPLSGIKIDKEAFWRLRATPALGQLVSLCFQLAENVLIEGIETERDHACALQSGAGLGQGFYWPSWTWPED